MQQKTKRPVQFEITDLTRQSIHEWIDEAHLRHDAFLFPSRVRASPHLFTPRVREDHSPMGRRDRPGWCGLRHRRTKNLRAVQLLLGHTKLESTVRYLGTQVDDALEMTEQTEV